MKLLYQYLVISMLSISSLPTWSATVVERRDTKGNLQKVTLEGQQAYIENDPQRHMLINLKTNKAYAIHIKDKQIMEMNIVGTPPTLPSSRSSAPPRVEAKLLKKGEGPKVAGYPTMIYQVMANGQVCSENYFSSEAVKVTNLKEFMEAMYTLSSSRTPKGIPLPPCLQAHDELEKESMSLGVPMRSIIKGGPKEKVWHEIVNIKTNISVGTEFFTLPKDFKIITEEDIQKEEIAKMKQWMKEHPQRRNSSEDQREPPSR